MLTTSSAPLRDHRDGSVPGAHASSQIDTATCTPRDHEERAGVGRRREVALLVEHRVVRQQLLAVDAEDSPFAQTAAAL